GGLTENEALRLVTLNPAIQLGIDNHVGSIEVGKDADFAIYNHDPLSVYAVVQKTIIDGKVYFDRQQDIARRAGLENERKDLLDKLEKESKPPKKPAAAEGKDEKKNEKKPEKGKRKKTPKPELVAMVAGGAQ